MEMFRSENKKQKTVQGKPRPLALIRTWRHLPKPLAIDHRTMSLASGLCNRGLRMKKMETSPIL